MDSRQAYNARRNAVPWRKWYKLQRWRDRRQAQLAAQPMCCMCKRRGVDRPATVANHTVRHNGDHDLFWHGKLNSMCANCHDSDQQRIEHGGKARPMVGADGWPIE